MVLDKVLLAPRNVQEEKMKRKQLTLIQTIKLCFIETKIWLAKNLGKDATSIGFFIEKSIVEKLREKGYKVVYMGWRSAEFDYKINFYKIEWSKNNVQDRNLL